MLKNPAQHVVLVKSRINNHIASTCSPPDIKVIFTTGMLNINISIKAQFQLLTRILSVTEDQGFFSCTEKEVFSMIVYEYLGFSIKLSTNRI